MGYSGKWRYGRLRLLLVAVGLAATSVSTQAQNLGVERKVSAKDCYALLQYVRWPNYRADGTVGDPFIVAVYEDSALVRVLRETQSVAGINGCTLEVADFATLPDTVSPQVLILAGGSSDAKTETIQQLRGQLVLTINLSDTVEDSGAILTLSSGKSVQEFSLHVTVDRDAATESGINLSPRLNRLERLQNE